MTRIRDAIAGLEALGLRLPRLRQFELGLDERSFTWLSTMSVGDRRRPDVFGTGPHFGDSDRASARALHIGRPPKTPWSRRIHRWANTYALNVTLALTILIAYSIN